MNKLVFFTIISLVFIQDLKAQQELEIQRVIDNLFEGMKEKKPELILSAFHPDAIMQTVISADAGAALGSNSVEDFVNRIAATPVETVLDERILEYIIKIDGQMASVWTPYRFYVNDNLSHCGVNSFQMIKTGNGWKITYIIDTRRKDDCL